MIYRVEVTKELVTEVWVDTADHHAAVEKAKEAIKKEGHQSYWGWEEGEPEFWVALKPFTVEEMLAEGQELWEPSET